MKIDALFITKNDYSHIMASVVMPVYNTNSKHLRASCASIINQSHKNNEFIIIDDCSNNLDTINELQNFRSYSNFKLIKNAINKGIAASLNAGINVSRGKYIFRMDSDDISTRTDC